MAVVCPTHPNERAVDVCGRCARAVCRHCAVGSPSASHLCGACALAGAGVRRRDQRPAAGRRRIRDARRDVLGTDGRSGEGSDSGTAPRSDPVDAPPAGPGTEPEGLGPVGSSSDSSTPAVGWWCDAEPAPGSWSQRF